MSAPVAARHVMLPIYAANVEISRAPWVTKEPMIALMRLQWWRDALDELASGTPRRHDVVDALAQLPRDALAPLQTTITARERDVEKDPFADPGAVLAYARDTTYGAMAACFQALGGAGTHAPQVLDIATALGTSRVMQSVVDLHGSGWRVFDQGWTTDVIADTANRALQAYDRAGAVLTLRSLAQAAFVETAGTARFLRHIAAHPDRVRDGTISGFPLRTAIDRARIARRVRSQA
ncbi:MAG: squalene/phytoene synthase family protein [Pseudomonadota bacterium]